jgi:hypothetical protein
MNLYEQNSPQTGEDDEPRAMTLEEFQQYRLSVEHVIEQADMAARLAKNADFKALIMEDYFTREPARLGQLMASGRLNEKQFQECVQDLRGVAGLRVFLGSFIQKGNIARDELAGLEEARKEMEASLNEEE